MNEIHNCLSCGGEITADDLFCGSCGAKIEPAEPIADTPPGECQNCGEPLSADDLFCGGCGQRVSISESVKMDTSLEPPDEQKPRSGKKGLIILIAIGLIVAAVYSYFQNAPPIETKQASAPNDRLVPSDGDIIELESLMIKAETEWLEAKTAGDKQKASKKHQEYIHYKTGLSHAEKMKTAFEEMLQAEKAGDGAKAQSRAHSYRHYSGQLVIMKKHAKQLPEFLDKKIKEWTGK